MTQSEKGKLIIVSGPSGVGKSTVIAKVMEKRDDLCFSVSVTTRAPRLGEKDGCDYFFVTDDQFAEMIKSGSLLEYAEYVGKCYGTPREYVERKLQEGMNVVLDIEVQGASKVKALIPESIMVFILPPGPEELEHRLRSRRSDSEEKIIERLIQAKKECAEAHDYDYIVINDDPDKAARELDSIITAEKCRTADRLKYIKEVLSL